MTIERSQQVESGFRPLLSLGAPLCPPQDRSHPFDRRWCRHSDLIEDVSGAP